VRRRTWSHDTDTDHRLRRARRQGRPRWPCHRAGRGPARRPGARPRTPRRHDDLSQGHRGQHPHDGDLPRLGRRRRGPRRWSHRRPASGDGPDAGRPRARHGAQRPPHRPRGACGQSGKPGVLPPGPHRARARPAGPPAWRGDQIRHRADRPAHRTVRNPGDPDRPDGRRGPVGPGPVRGRRRWSAQHRAGRPRDRRAAPGHHRRVRPGAVPRKPGPGPRRAPVRDLHPAGRKV
jgi:hypothetical protein